MRSILVKYSLAMIAMRVAVTMLIVALAGAQPSAANQELAASKPYRVLLDALFPMESDRANVVYRYHRASRYLEEPEYLFALNLEKHTNNEVSANVIVGDGDSVYAQVVTLLADNPRLTQEELRRAVKVRRLTITERECPALKERAHAFEVLQFPPPALDLIIMDSPQHDIRIQDVISTLEFTTGDSAHPLIKWAIATRRALEACAASAR